eukprot:TRINITY_DN17941_c0_g1_i1.p1 TRINITY_DN17941_c0_g1~~TRINITY_DN17941_c0_g1_i1.p1  ORF type:complete len:930 (-),score=185.06 TRINITY_DN17941_c0_g1_i1:145-2547(-)
MAAQGGNNDDSGHDHGGRVAHASQGTMSGHGGYMNHPHHPGDAGLAMAAQVRPAQGQPMIPPEDMRRLLVSCQQSIMGEDIQGVARNLNKISKTEVTQAFSQQELEAVKDMLKKTHMLLHQITERLQPKDLADLVKACGAFPTMHGRQYKEILEMMNTMAELAKTRVDKMTPTDLTTLVYTFASTQHRDEKLMSMIAAEVVSKKKEFDHMQLSHTAWAYAKCGLWNKQLVEAIAAEYELKIAQSVPGSLARVAWSMAQWGTLMKELMNAIALEVGKKRSKFNTEALAMIAWSFTSLKVRDDKLMAVISAEACNKIDMLKVQDLAHLAWAFARQKISDQKLFGHVATEVKRSSTRMQTSEIANVVWAFARMQTQDEALRKALFEQAIVSMSTFKPSDVSMLSWACTVEKAAVPRSLQTRLLTSLGTHVAQGIHEYTPPQLAQVAHSMGALSLYHHGFCSALTNHILCRGSESLEPLKAYSLVNVAWSLARVHMRNDLLLQGIENFVSKALDVKPILQCRTLWAFQVLHFPCPNLVNTISEQAAAAPAHYSAKVLVKLNDAVYTSASGRGQQIIEDMTQSRMQLLVEYFKRVWSDASSLEKTSDDVYAAKIVELSEGLVDAGATGTPTILKQLGIGMPSRDFVFECQRIQPGTGDIPENFRLDTDLAVCRYELRLGQESYRNFFLHDQARSAETEAELRRNGPLPWIFKTVDMHGAPGSGMRTPCFTALLAVLQTMVSMGAQLEDPASCSQLIGDVQMLSTTVPCLSTLGALRQFHVRFPGVALCFCEQVLSDRVTDAPAMV